MNATVAQTILDHIQACYPCTFGQLVAEVMTQSLHVTEVAHHKKEYQAQGLTVEAVNKLLRSGHVGLYDTGDAFTLGENFVQPLTF